MGLHVEVAPGHRRQFALGHPREHVVSVDQLKPVSERAQVAVEPPSAGRAAGRRIALERMRMHGDDRRTEAVGPL